MKNVDFEINGIGYTRQDNGYCYKHIEYPVENGKTHRQSTRIGKSEYSKAYDQFIQSRVEEAEESVATEEAKEVVKANKGMTFEEVIAMAQKHYNEGGDGIVECWDVNFYNAYVEQFGPITEKVVYDIIGIKPPKKATRRTRKVQVGGFEFTEGEFRVCLTEKQVKFIKLMTTSDFWENGLDSCLWIDVLCDELEVEMGPMTIGAMVSTLREKGLLLVGKDKRNHKERKAAFFELSELGKKVVAKVLGL